MQNSAKNIRNSNTPGRGALRGHGAAGHDRHRSVRVRRQWREEEEEDRDRLLPPGRGENVRAHVRPELIRGFKQPFCAATFF